jgi:fucose permease
MIGAPLAAVFASHFTHDWKLLFLVFGIVSILSVIWLGAVKIDEAKTEVKATFGSSFRLLGTGFVLMMVMSIFLVVGVDVGFNSNSGNFLVKHFGIDPTAAESGRSVYFFGRMLGTFAGALLLTRISTGKFFLWTTVLGIISFVVMLLVTSQPLAWILVFMIGLSVANIWPLVFSLAVQKYPDRSNEISGLMMMAISGGAVIPLLVGWISDLSNVAIGMSVLILCMVYLFVVSLMFQKK